VPELSDCPQPGPLRSPAADTRETATGRSLTLGLGIFGFLRDQRLMPRMANLRQLRKPATVGQEAKMADPHEPLRQDMQQVTANEFGAIKPEVFFFLVVPVILVT